MLLDQKARSKEQAAINYQKLMKYLPQRTAGQSVGMTESAQIAANNALSQQQAVADATFQQGMMDLNNYVREQEKAEQDGLYNEIMTTIDSGSWNTTDELKAYLWGEPTQSPTGPVYSNKQDSIYSKLSPEQKAQVDQRLRMYENNPEQIAADKEYEERMAPDRNKPITSDKVTGIGGVLGNTNEGNNFKIGEYKVELGAEADEETVPADKVKDILDKKPFVYNGEIYIKVNGKVYTVRSRANAGNSDDYDKARKLISGKK